MGLVAVSQDSMMATQASSEATLNICKAYRRFVFPGLVKKRAAYLM